MADEIISGDPIDPGTPLTPDDPIDPGDLGDYIVPGILTNNIQIAKNGIWRSLLGKKVAKGGVWYNFGANCGITKGGLWYILRDRIASLSVKPGTYTFAYNEMTLKYFTVIMIYTDFDVYWKPGYQMNGAILTKDGTEGFTIRCSVNKTGLQRSGIVVVESGISTIEVPVYQNGM